MKNLSIIQFQRFSVVVGVLLFAVKFFAFWLTGSNAIFSDALESIINVAAGSFALYSLVLAAKPKDLDHPYGHGKIEFISSGFEGSLIVIAGAGIIYKSIYNLFDPQELTSLDLGLCLTAGAGALNFGLGVVTERYGIQHHSPTMVASGKHLKSDGYSSLGLIIGLVVVLLTNMVWLDSVIAILFGLLIGYTGIKEIRKSIAGIMDEADLKLLAKIIDHLDKERLPNWIDLHNMRAQKFGSQIHVDCHMTLPHYLTVKEGHTEVEKLESSIASQFKEGFEIFIHTDPCEPSSCKLCLKNDCSVRQHPFDKRTNWNLDNVLKNQRHQ